MGESVASLERDDMTEGEDICYRHLTANQRNILPRYLGCHIHLCLSSLPLPVVKVASFVLYCIVCLFAMSET